jgi:hypothetical protein
MLTQLPAAEPRLDCRFHAALLAAAILGTAAARATSAQAPLAVAFAGYGTLHGVCVAWSLRPRPTYSAVLAFLAAACLMSGALARLGLAAVPLLGRTGMRTAALLVLAAAAFFGALGYGVLLRRLLRGRPTWRALLAIAPACLIAACAGLLLMRWFPVGGSAWLAVLWWLAFSAGLCAAVGSGRRDGATNPLK